MLISVLASGQVTVNKDEIMDAGEYSSLAESSGNEPVIQIFVSQECPQQQVIDVLNCIRGANINTMTFTDIGN